MIIYKVTAFSLILKTLLCKTLAFKVRFEAGRQFSVNHHQRGKMVLKVQKTQAFYVFWDSCHPYGLNFFQKNYFSGEKKMTTNICLASSTYQALW